MAEYLVDNSDLISVADAIRSKRGTTNKIAFPDGFISEINKISSDNVYIPTEPYIEETYDTNGNIVSAILHGHTQLRTGLFRDSLALTSVTLPDSLIRIRSAAFYKCSELSLTALPDSIIYIDSSAFYSCYKLTLTALPNSIKYIDDYAFQDCSSLLSLVFPEGLYTIGVTSFSSCTKLTSVTFKGTPTSIDSTAFSNCTRLTSIKVPWGEGAVANAPWGATNATITYNYIGE